MSHWETHKKDCSEMKRFEKLKNFSTEIVAMCAELGDYQGVQEFLNLSPAQQQYYDEVYGKALKNKTLRDLYKKAVIAEREHGQNSTEFQAAKQLYQQAKNELLEKARNKYLAKLQSTEDDSPAARGPPRSCYIFQFVPEELHGFVLDTIRQAVRQ